MEAGPGPTQSVSCPPLEPAWTRDLHGATVCLYTCTHWLNINLKIQLQTQCWHVWDVWQWSDFHQEFSASINCNTYSNYRYLQYRVYFPRILNIACCSCCSCYSLGFSANFISLKYTRYNFYFYTIHSLLWWCKVRTRLEWWRRPWSTSQWTAWYPLCLVRAAHP